MNSNVHCADVGMRIAVQMQKFAFQARVWTRPATTSLSCPFGYEEGSSAEYEHDCNRRVAAPVAIDNADHASSGVIKFSGYTLDGSLDVNKSLTTT